MNTDRAPAAFDPVNLTPRASLNRALIADLPGIAPDPDVRGLPGHELLSAQALATAIGSNAADLRLDPASNPIELLPALDRCLGAQDPTIRAAARTLARHFGRSLGYFLVMLHRGDAINRHARDDWDDTYWEYWAGVRTVWLGGGIASGRLGIALREHAAAVLEECGCSAPALHLARHAAILPLIGAARSLPASLTARATEAAIVLDFGGTTIKRAHATYTGGALASLNILSPLPTPHLTLGRSPAPPGATETAYQFAERIADIIAATWRTATSLGLPLIPHVSVSLASYVHDGHPLLRQSGRYTDLCALPPPAAHVLSRRVSELIGQELTVTLLHDGTAAARTYAETPNAAVIMLGTALGVGFSPPSVGALRPMLLHFSITPAR